MSYTSLAAPKIVETLRRLSQRIKERFPDAGLYRVSCELAATAERCAREADALGKPIWPLRIAVGVLVVGITVLCLVVAWTLRPSVLQPMPFGDAVQVFEAAVNDVVFLAIAIWFLVSIEKRVKRSRALRSLHQLRSIAHIIDMHQLTKDPERLLSQQPDTASSPTRVLTGDQLGRYLDYCSELLSVSAKVAALYAQSLDDPIVLASVNDHETLTTGLSRKIWQKISILEAAVGREVVR